MLLSSYITKSYYVFNDVEYEKVIEKIIKEEKRRKIKVTKEDNVERPTLIFKNMFQNPSPWMGYTDELTKDYMETQENFANISNPNNDFATQYKSSLSEKEIKNIQSKIDRNKETYKKIRKVNEGLSEQFKILSNHIKNFESKKEDTINVKEFEEWKKSIRIKDNKEKQLVENFKVEEKLKKKLNNYQETLRHMI